MKNGIRTSAQKLKTPGFAAVAAIAAVAAVLAVIVIVNNMTGREALSVKNPNLALKKGVKAACDSVETEELSADKVIDGDDETLSSRWSSENNWEDASHYIELEFPEEISVSFVILKWERTNVTSYRIEGSSDGREWMTLVSFNSAPAGKRQEIVLPEAVNVRFLRLSTDAVSQDEDDYSNLYQNVSLYEFEVYADKPAKYYVEAPVIEEREDGSRFLKMPEAPEGYVLEYLGADYEQIIGAEREIYETIQDKDVVVGFSLESLDGADADMGIEEKEVSFTVRVPASDFGDRKINSAAANEAPEVIPAIAEWQGAEGKFYPAEYSRIIIEDESLEQTAKLFALRYTEIMEYEIPVIVGSEKELKAGDFYLSYDSSGAAAGVGEEGYVCKINDICVIKAPYNKGIYWGTITILQILKNESGSVPCGIIRDYPKYEVRGFGIDVARKPVSMSMLYRIMENMSWYKLNDLSIHLNDNEILGTSNLTGSFEDVMTAYSAFRIDTSVTNKEGEKLTSEDYSYTAKEFADFINISAAYGVRIVPEIDTPAHSLSITRIFPEYALRVSNESADQLDLSKKKVRELVKDIWRETLKGAGGSEDELAASAETEASSTEDAAASVESAAAFEGAEIVNIGMDEYYGKGETYRKYMNEIIEFVHEEGGIETVRLWGSLGNMEGTTMPSAEGLQMNIWSDIWADPVDMYEQGYSLINMQNNHLYIIAGGGYDYLDTQELYRNWEPNRFYDNNNSETIPSYSPRMLGAAYMIWNDMSGNLDVGISEVDLFDRFFSALGVSSGKLWGETDEDNLSYEEYESLFHVLGTAPESNPYALKIWEQESFNLMETLNPDSLKGHMNENNIISLSGASDYVETGYAGGNGNGFGIGGDYKVSMEVYKQSKSTSNINNQKPNTPEEEILFETDSVYGETAFKAVQAVSGKVGFSREGRDYSFDYTLPEEEWVKLTICGTKNRTSLYINDKLIDTLGDDQPFNEYADFVFPLERIGSKTDSFCGMIKNIIIE